MAKKKEPANEPNQEAQTPDSPQTEQTEQTEQTAQAPQLTAEEIQKLMDDGKAMAEAYAQERDQRLRMAAEFDNFRKRSQKEKDALYQTAQAETVAKFLPVYDNIQRAIAQPTADEAYAHGVELTAAGLSEILEKLGVVPFGKAGDSFDPQKHNAVMHIEDESLEQNVVAEVFQQGFMLGERVIRFAMVKAAN